MSRCSVMLLLFVSASVFGSDLDLRYSVDPFYEEQTVGNSMGRDMGGHMMVAETRGALERNRKRRFDAQTQPKKARAENQNSVWPSIAGCGLMVLSFLGDSSAWLAGSAGACAFGVMYSFH